MKNLRKTIGLLTLGLLLVNSNAILAQDTNTETAEERKEVRKADREGKKAQVAAWRAEIDEIKANTSLTQEQKNALIKEKREDIKALRGDKGKRGKKGKKAKGEEHKLKRDQLKAIKDDASLSEEEKETRMNSIKDEFKTTHGDKMKDKGKGKKGKAIKKAERATERGNLDEEQINRALKGLERAEKSVSKMYEKGKITEEVYNTRLAKIKEVRAKLIP